jgi:uncharacterized repeat protein (TIGR01451 family)
MIVKRGMKRRVLMVAVLAVAAIALPSTAMAQVFNTGTGDVAGDGTAITDSNQFELNSTTLALVKRAFDMDDNPIPSGSSIPVGSQFKFMLYINNTSPVAVADISLQDIIDPTGFAYTTDSTRVDNSVAACALAACDAAEELTVFQAVNLTSALTDATDGDAVSYDIPTTTLDVGDGVVGGNDTVTIGADSVLAVTFTVTMQ